jgi:hypothetical protein
MNWICSTAVVILLAFCAWVWMKDRQIWQLQRRAERHLCLKCGYDLRGSRERCTECGEVMSPALDSLALRTAWPVDRITALPLQPGEALTVIYETAVADDALMLSLQLDARGVPAKREERPWPGRDGLTLFQVVVRLDDGPRAIGICKSFERSLS